MTGAGDGASYTRIAVLLHWLSALLVIGMFFLGWYMVDLPRGPLRGQNFALHKSIGLTIFLLTVLRLGWRLAHPPLAYDAGMTQWRRQVAKTAHRIFYLLLVLQPVSGYLSSSFSGYKTKWFGIPLPHWGYKNPELNQFFTDIHVGCSLVLLGLIVVHVLGAVLCKEQVFVNVFVMLLDAIVACRDVRQGIHLLCKLSGKLLYFTMCTVLHR